MKTRRNLLSIAALFALALALLLEALPGGVTMRFAAGPGDYLLETFSFFDLTPLGYGDLAPMAAGILTGAALILVLAGLLKGSAGLRRAALTLTVLACLSAILQLVLFGQMNLMGAAVAALLAVSGMVQASALP